MGPGTARSLVTAMKLAEPGLAALRQHGQRDPLRLGGGHGLADERLGVGRGSAAVLWLDAFESLRLWALLSAGLPLMAPLGAHRL